MADTINLAAEVREEFGKGASRRIRRQHKIPAVLYGRGDDPIHITLPGHETMLALRQANALLSIVVPGGEEKLALPKQVQRHPVRHTIEHVDLLIVRRGERVVVSVPVVLVGEPVEMRLTIRPNLTGSPRSSWGVLASLWPMKRASWRSTAR